MTEVMAVEPALQEVVDATVISVDYRLAPEHPFPIPYEECRAVTKYVSSHLGEFGG